jgi:uncharacterized membrane protein YfcA
MGLRAVAGVILGLLGVICAVVGIFVLEGISIEVPGIILGTLGYYFVIMSKDRARPDPGHRRDGAKRYLHDHKRPFGTATVANGGQVHP